MSIIKKEGRVPSTLTNDVEGEVEAAAGESCRVLATAVVHAIVVWRCARERERSLFVVDPVVFIPLCEMNAISEPAACWPVIDKRVRVTVNVMYHSLLYLMLWHSTLEVFI